MALRGNLKDFSLPDVFQLVTFSRKTGVLRIKRQDGDEGSVWFRDGDVFFAQSNWHTELLGERLVRAQRLTPQALAKALDLRDAEQPGGRRLGQILVDEGYLTDKVLESFVSEQIQETIFDLMRWDEGEFDFEAMPEAVEEDIGLSVSIENVIMEGSRRLEEWARIRKKIPSMDVVFKMATAPGEGTFEISLKPTEWNLLLLVDGSRSVADLAHATNRTDFEVARIIYGLFSAGLLEFATDEEIARLRAERTEREAKVAAIEAERVKAKQARAAAVQARDAALAAAAARRAAENAPASGQPSVTAVPEGPVEEPEFLGGAVSAPTAEDAAVLEEMIGAVLRPQSPPAPAASATPAAPAIPHTPAEEPAFMGMDHAEEPDLVMVPVPSVDDLLTDLAELQQTPESVEAAAEAVAATLESVAPVAEPVVESPTAEPEPAEEAVALESGLPPVVIEPVATPVEAAESPALEPNAGSDVGVSLPSVEAVAEPEPQLPAIEVESAALVVEPEVVVEAAAPDTMLLPELTLEPEVPAAVDAGINVPEVIAVSAAAPESADVPIVAWPEPEIEAAVATPEPDIEAAATTPVPEPAPEPEPAVESEPVAVAESATVPVPAVPVEDFERDLMALGLGELPADLGGPSPLAHEAALESPAAVQAPQPPTVTETPEATEVQPEFAWIAEGTEGEAPLPAQAEPLADVSDELAAISELAELATPELAAPLPAAEAVEADGPDFSELLESLDIDSPEAEAGSAPIAAEVEFEPLGFDDDLLAEVAGESGGVISTDAFLEDITIDEMGFSGEMTDELSALTGATRPGRPAASVNRIPDAGSGEVLRRDARVDRDTLMKIIDGIKNL